MEKVTWYIDESGNTGNIRLNDAGNMNYLDERYFVLGGLRLDSTQLKNLDDEINQLKNKHRINFKELKSTNLYRKKKDFLIDFFKLLKDLKIKVLAELIDKKYNLSIQIIDNTIKPPLDKKRDYAQWITENLDNKDYKSFLEANQTKSKETFEKYINDLLTTLYKKSEEFVMKSTPSEDLSCPLIQEDYAMKIIKETLEANYIESSIGFSTAYNIKNYLENSIKKYKKNLKKKIKKPHYLFLPIEDKSKNNKIYTHLPHVNCFINLFLRGIPSNKDTNIKFIHDTQKEFGPILEKNFNLTINHLKLNNNLKLEFKDSLENKGIQYSDLVAGTLHKVWRDYVIKNDTNEKIKELYDVLTDVVIINIVVPDSFISSNKKTNKIIHMFLLKEDDSIANQNLKNFLQ